VKNRLSDTDYGELLVCIQSIHACRTLGEFPTCVLTELRRLVHCKLGSYNEVNTALNRVVVVFDPPTEMSEKLYRSFEINIPQHPVISYVSQSGDGQTLKISDFLTTREYHKLPLYQDFYRHYEVEDQLAFGVQVDPGFLIGIAFNRSERSFTEKDRLLLNMIRPHIIQAYSRLAEVSGHREQQLDFQAALRQHGLGIIGLHADGAVAHATPGAFESLSRFVPVPDAEPARLPEDLKRWALEGADHVPKTFTHDSAKLVLRRVVRDSRIVLLLSEETDTVQAERLKQYKLTPRELEVLKWLAECKSNAEIATILGLSAATVKLHVERILAKLGVENRMAATLLVRGTSV